MNAPHDTPPAATRGGSPFRDGAPRPPGIQFDPREVEAPSGEVVEVVVLWHGAVLEVCHLAPGVPFVLATAARPRRRVFWALALAILAGLLVALAGAQIDPRMALAGALVTLGAALLAGLRAPESETHRGDSGRLVCDLDASGVAERVVVTARSPRRWAVVSGARGAVEEPAGWRTLPAPHGETSPDLAAVAMEPGRRYLLTLGDLGLVGRLVRPGRRARRPVRRAVGAVLLGALGVGAAMTCAAGLRGVETGGLSGREADRARLIARVTEDERVRVVRAMIQQQAESFPEEEVPAATRASGSFGPPLRTRWHRDRPERPFRVETHTWPWNHGTERGAIELSLEDTLGVLGPLPAPQPWQGALSRGGASPATLIEAVCAGCSLQSDNLYGLVEGDRLFDAPRCGFCDAALWVRPALDLPTVVQATLSAVQSDPREDVDSIRRAAVRNLGMVWRCYEQARASRPTSTGRVVVRLTIDPTGAVSDARSEVRAGSLRAVGACVEEAVRRWQFASPTGPGASAARLTFDLEEVPPHTS